MSSVEAPVQTGRLLALTTPLGGDVLIATELSGTEGLSQLFRFTVAMVSVNRGITADSLLGKSLTVRIARSGGDPRYVNGVVTGFSAADYLVGGLRRYEVVVEPELWLLTRTSDCRIFQNQTVLEIAEALLSEGGISNYMKQGLVGSHPKRDYCVQYRETDYDFLVRLFAEEGIYFYFAHASGNHSLVLSDSTVGYAVCADASVRHGPATTSSLLGIQRWATGYHFQSGKTTLQDYHFEQPSADLTASTSTIVDNTNFQKWEVFDYPGAYVQKAVGTTLSRVRMEATEAGYCLVAGASNYAGFAPGTKFTLTKHNIADEQGKSYVLRTVDHHAKDNTHLGNQTEKVVYENSFTALPATATFRPLLSPRRPLVAGPHTALVVGPKGEEIYCDKYGRVRIQFYWDRLGKKDDSSSCWVRVGQMLAGTGWGAQFTPRVGMEVIVVFLEGDPDRPLIVGTVYNGENMPPYPLPDNKTQSGIKTRSSANGNSSTFNEFRFDDKRDNELIYVRAQKDFTRDVANNDTLIVKKDQTITIENDRGVTISKGNDVLTVTSGNHSVKVGSGNSTLQCDGGSITLSAGQSITLKVGGNSLVINQSGMTLKATQVAVSADVKAQVSGSMVNINGNATIQVKGGLVTIN